VPERPHSGNHHQRSVAAARAAPHRANAADELGDSLSEMDARETTSTLRDQGNMPVRTGGGHNHWRDLAKAGLIKGGCIRLAHEVRSRTEASGRIVNNLP